VPETSSNVQKTEPAHKSAEANSGQESVVLVKSGAVFKGAQEFVVTTSAINLEKPGTLTREKVALVEKFLRPALLTGRIVLDISASPGFFLFSALQNNAASLKAASTDLSFVDLMTKATKHLEVTKITAHKTNWRALSEQAEIVLALDSNQWLSDRTHDLKNIEDAVAKIASLTTYAAIVQDPSEVPSSGTALTTKRSVQAIDFERCLKKHFNRVELAGEADGHNIFLCFQSMHEIDLRCPLPEFEEAGQLISCRQLTEFAGLEYWSRVYDGGDVIYKQATRDLVHREQSILSKLESPFFPRVLEVNECGDSSVLVLEKINGINLERYSSTITSSVGNLMLFALECLQILNELQIRGIQHRDIQPGNILIRDDKPVLIDFGWAVSEDLPMFVPAGLLSVSEDAQACDAYAIGKILLALTEPKYPELASVFALMTEPDPLARVTSATDLSALLKLAAASAASLPASAADLAMGDEQAALLTKLITNLRLNRARFEASQKEYTLLEDKTRTDRDHRLAVLEMEYDKVVTEVNKVIAELHRVIGEKDELLILLDERQKLIEGITQGQAWQLANRLQKSKQKFGSMFGKAP
jgi:tRNA A-37 threonylcarbamoyl transferase component Bud32